MDSQKLGNALQTYPHDSRDPEEGTHLQVRLSEIGIDCFELRRDRPSHQQGEPLTKLRVFSAMGVYGTFGPARGMWIKPKSAVVVHWPQVTAPCCGFWCFEKSSQTGQKRALEWGELRSC